VGSSFDEIPLRDLAPRPGIKRGVINIEVGLRPETILSACWPLAVQDYHEREIAVQHGLKTAFAFGSKSTCHTSFVLQN
jgi:hypothetical protein